MHLKATLLKWLKLFAGDTRRAIVGYIVVNLILAWGNGEVLAKIGLNYTFQLANIRLPLWVAISLVLLCCLCTYIIARRILTKKDQPSSTPYGNLNEQSLPPVSPHPRTRLPRLQEKILLHLFSHKHKQMPYTFQIAQALDMPKGEDTVKYHLEELYKQKFVKRLSLPVRGLPGQQSWSIERKGETYLRENKLISQSGKGR